MTISKQISTQLCTDRVVLSVGQKIAIKSSINRWISDNFPQHRSLIVYSIAKQNSELIWEVELSIKLPCNEPQSLGLILVSTDGKVIEARKHYEVCQILDGMLKPSQFDETHEQLLSNELQFLCNDGIEGAKTLTNKSVDLLLTDPPYGISSPYICENQVQRRLRSDGSDFIMPKGNFGEWDNELETFDWMEIVLPKVCGWVVVFCAQAQIGEYSKILKNNQFVAVGTMIWQKTNPVPFNHKFKPINAWEALVIGKRPGTKFNGRLVHNVFKCNSPSPSHRIHSTQKPLPLIKKFILLFSDKGDLVFDPFAGSATTVIAAYDLKRKSLAFEKDPCIYQAAYKRITKACPSILTAESKNEIFM